MVGSSVATGGLAVAKIVRADNAAHASAEVSVGQTDQLGQTNQTEQTVQAETTGDTEVQFSLPIEASTSAQTQLQTQTQTQTHHSIQGVNADDDNEGSVDAENSGSGFFGNDD